jgi:hypothetical protein
MMADESPWGRTATFELPHDRPIPDLRPALMSVAGSLAALGAVVFAADLFSGGRALAVLVMAVLVALGYVVLALAPPLLAPLGVVFVATGVGALPPFLLVDETTDSFTGIVALMTLLWAFTWFVPLTQGRPFLLGLALASAWLLLLDLSDDGSTIDTANVFGSENTPFYLSLFVGVGLLAASWAIDRQERPGLATPFVVVGDLAAVTGAFAVAGDLGDTGGSVLVIVTGLVLGIIGHAATRRLTTWLGAAVMGGGVVGLVSAMLGDDPDTRTGAFAFVLAGVILAGLLVVIDQQRRTPETVAGAAVSPSTTTTSAGWHPDPMGRFAYRWWDGVRWTDQVVDHAGRQVTDPDASPNW